MTAPSSPLPAPMPGTTEPLTDGEIERLHAWARRGHQTPSGLVLRALTELRARRASEESHRRIAAGFEEMAYDLANFMARHIVGEKFAAGNEACRECVDRVKSVMASVHKTAMERAAGIADKEGDEGLGDEGPGMAYHIRDTIRRAAAETGT